VAQINIPRPNDVPGPDKDIHPVADRKQGLSDCTETGTLK
jgi:hypothetical protein